MGLEELTTDFKVEVLQKIHYTIVKVVREDPAAGTGKGTAAKQVLYMAYRETPGGARPSYDGLSCEELKAHPDYIDNAFYAMCEQVHRNTGLEIE